MHLSDKEFSQKAVNVSGGIFLIGGYRAKGLLRQPIETGQPLQSAFQEANTGETPDFLEEEI